MNEKSVKNIARILLIEDDDNISGKTAEYLTENGYEVTAVKTYREAMEKKDESYDLALVDINLPDGRGNELIKKLKVKNTRVIITTVKNDEDFIVKSLDSGADDYITKPFSLSILRARTDAVLRTVSANLENRIRCNDLTLNLDIGNIYYIDELVELASIEYQFLSLFIINPNRIFTRNQLLERFWENRNQFVNENTLTATVKRIRDKTSKSVITTM